MKKSKSSRTQARYNQIKHKYGLSREDYLKMYERQSKSCAICGKHEDEISRSLHIDHCHDTGKVRALLCGKCNSGIGYFDDKFDLLLAAAKYIQAHGDIC